MIQIISFDKLKFQSFKQYKISSLDEFNSFDDYDINIIDLSNKEMWKYKGKHSGNLNNISDMHTISAELKATKKSKIIIVFPQNCNFYYSWDYFYKKFEESVKIKNILENVINIISNLFEINGFDISYSKNQTQIGEKIYYSDFNFVELNENSFEIKSTSDNSNKITTINYNNFILTTLDLFSTEEHLDNFIQLLINSKKENEIPKWIKDVNFFDDAKIKEEIKKNEEKIFKYQNSNKEFELKLDSNNRLKSILYTTGDELVEVVMKILDELLEYDSSSFVDKKKEDFLIKKETITFVGEIKGISSAVANKNVSQLDVHVQDYIDKITTENIKENVKGLLIINHQRDKELEYRNEIHQNQINLAKRNGSLIVETNILLMIYEKFLLQELKTEDILKLFSEKIGVLGEDDLNNYE